MFLPERVHEAFFDIHPVTGATIEVFFDGGKRRLICPQRNVQAEAVCKKKSLRFHIASTAVARGSNGLGLRKKRFCFKWLLARPERFERPTLRFVVSFYTIP